MAQICAFLRGTKRRRGRVITGCAAWAAMQRDLAAGDRIMERAFCAGPVDRRRILPAGYVLDIEVLGQGRI